MLPRTLAVALLLLAAPLALVPVASADTCASVVLEPLVCTPVYAFYCAFYGVTFEGGIKGITVNDVPGCLVRVALRCVETCPGGGLDVVLP